MRATSASALVSSNLIKAVKLGEGRPEAPGVTLISTNGRFVSLFLDVTHAYQSIIKQVGRLASSSIHRKLEGLGLFGIITFNPNPNPNT